MSRDHVVTSHDCLLAAPAVRKIWLRGCRPGLSFFFDERGLTGGVYWIPKLGEELGKADMVLLGGILPICKMAMSFLSSLGSASGRRCDARQIHCRSGAMVKDGGALARATSIGPKGGNGSLCRCGWWHSSLRHRGAAAITIVYRLYGRR